MTRHFPSSEPQNTLNDELYAVIKTTTAEILGSGMRKKFRRVNRVVNKWAFYEAEFSLSSSSPTICTILLTLNVVFGASICLGCKTVNTHFYVNSPKKPTRPNFSQFENHSFTFLSCIRFEHRRILDTTKL